MEKSLDLSRVLSVLKKKWKLLVFLPIIFGVISLLISFLLMGPKYQATTQILVNQKESDKNIMAQEVQSNIQLVNTYKEIIKSPRILDEVAKKNKKYSADDLDKIVDIKNESDSQILKINVKTDKKATSEKMANQLAKTAVKEMPKIMSIDNVSILSKADGTAKKVSPKPILNLAVGLILGFIIALMIVLIRTLFDQHIRTEEDVEKELDLPVLGTIQKVK